MLGLLRGRRPADVSVMNTANYAAGAHKGRKLQRGGKGGIPTFCLKFFNFLNEKKTKQLFSGPKKINFT